MVLILVLALVATLGIGCKKKEEPLSEQVAASVNDTKVFADEVVLWQAILEDGSGIKEWNDENKATVKENLKGRIKEIATLTQMAIDSDLDLTEEEKTDIDEQVQQFFDDMPEEIKNQGVTIETAKRAFYKDALVGKIFDKTVTEYAPSDSEVEEALNKDQTYVESVTQDPGYYMQKVTVKHILIKTINDDGTPKSEEEQTKAKVEADEILEKVQSGEDFVTLVQEYSEDTGSLTTDGEITFGRGEMVPQFEEASFDMEIGEIRLVQTDYGWHIIRLEAIPVITTEDYEAYQDSLQQYKEQAHSSMLSYLQTQYFWENFEENSKDYNVEYVDEFWNTLKIGTIFS